MMTGPSIHLSWSELACKDGTPYPALWRADRAIILGIEYEKVRANCGGVPLVVGSAYRTPVYNLKVGGKKNSQHPEGRALDLYPPTGMMIDEFYERIHSVAMLESSAIYGLGLYPTFVHMDVRPGPRFVVWRGVRAWAELKS